MSSSNEKACGLGSGWGAGPASPVGGLHPLGSLAGEERSQVRTAEAVCKKYRLRPLSFCKGGRQRDFSYICTPLRLPPWLRHGEGHGNPLQYSCLENPLDRGAWWAIVHRTAKSQTQLRQLSRQAGMVQTVKNTPAVQEGWVRSLVGQVPWRRKWQSTPVFLPGESHGPRSQAGYNP